jgi:MYXO-CTERM domain-containing protein
MNSVQRLGAGCVDTDDNSVDFESPTRPATPRWSGSPLNDCSVLPPVDAGPMDTGVDIPIVDAARDTGTDVPRVDVATDTARDVATDVSTPDTGVDSGVDAGTPDAGRVDAGSTDARVDAARADAARDGARDATGDAGNTTNPRGCGCSTPGTEGARSPFALLAAIAVAGAIQRRRRAVLGGA